MQVGQHLLACKGDALLMRSTQYYINQLHEAARHITHLLRFPGLFKSGPTFIQQSLQIHLSPFVGDKPPQAQQAPVHGPLHPAC